MPNPIYRQATDAITNFLGFGGKTNIVYDKFLENDPSPRMDKALEQRGYMRFHYSVDAQSIHSPTTRFIPFFEDPIIKENRSANYASHDVLLRNEPYRTYVNSSPRELSIEINFSLPQIIAYFNNYLPMISDRERQELDQIRESIREIIIEDYKFDDKFKLGNEEQETGLIIGNTIFANSVPGEGPRMPAVNNIPLGDDAQENLFFMRGYAIHWLLNSPRTKIIQTFESLAQHFLNIIRTSVLSSSGQRGAIFGPPIFLLKFGALYDHLPCIVSKYDLEFRGDYGWQNSTLFPRVIRLKIDAQEFRQSIGTFQSDENDSPPGWDEIFEYKRDIPSNLK